MADGEAAAKKTAVEAAAAATEYKATARWLCRGRGRGYGNSEGGDCCGDRG